MKMKVALGPMEMMTDSLRLSEGVPEQMKKGELTLVLLVTETDTRCLFRLIYVHLSSFVILLKRQFDYKTFILKCLFTYYVMYVCYVLMVD